MANGNNQPQTTATGQQAGPPPPPPPPPVRRRRKLRWEFFWIVLAVMAAAWFIHHVPGPTFTWEDVMNTVGVSRRGEGRYTRTALFGLVVIGIVWVLKAIRSK
jgi:hypothetical protein